MPLNKPAAWYASEEAVLIGRNILSYQTPPAAGARTSRATDRRARGQAFVGNNNSKFATPGDFDLPRTPPGAMWAPSTTTPPSLKSAS